MDMHVWEETDAVKMTDIIDKEQKKDRKMNSNASVCESGYGTITRCCQSDKT